MGGGGGGNIPLRRKGKLITPRNTLHGDVLLLDTGSQEGLFGAVNERLDDGFIPSCVYDADAEIGACPMVSEGHKCRTD